MSSNQSQRPIFFEDQYLGAEDLNAEIDYCRIQEARHALGAHTWGIAAGLQITEKDSPSGGQVDAYIQPGYAWDGFGRPIVVLAPYKIPAELFKSILYDAVIDGGTPEGRLIQVWLRYHESAVNAPPAGFGGCDTNGQFSRIQETFRVEVGERPNHGDRHSPVAVAGLSVDAQGVLQRLNPQTNSQAKPVVLYDESIPYQDFPEDGPKAKWLIPLGGVRWKPNPDPNLQGDFVKRGKADLDKSFSQRIYIGVIAGTVYAADQVIRMRDRMNDYSKVMSTDLVWVEGDLRTEGDVHLFDGKVDFRDANGLDKGIPLIIQRQDLPGPQGSLQAIIGKDNQGANSFSVGPLEPNPPPNTLPKIQAKLTVLDNGNVGIGISTPAATLEIGGDLALDKQVSGAARMLPAGGTMLWNDGTWLRLNQNLDFSTPVPGVVTPSLFASGSLNVGGAGNWGDPGPGNLWVTGKVGIGTNNPAATLEIGGDLALDKQVSGVARVLPIGGTMLWNDGTWLRLNQNLDYSKPILGVHTPGVFASGSLNVGGAGGWGDPGPGNLWVVGKVGIGTTTPTLPLDIQGDFGRDNGPVTTHLWGSRIGDTGAAKLFIRASSGGDVVFDDASNKVGVGLNGPICKLHVTDSTSGDASNVNAHVAVIENTNAGNEASVLALKVGINAPNATNNFITFFGGNSAIGHIEGNGSGVTLASGGADFAEFLPRLCADEAIEEGDVVGIFSGSISKTTIGAHHVAAITGRPVVVGNLPSREREPFCGQVALLGQVGVKVRGKVQAGDFIVPSGLNDGVGLAVSPDRISGAESAQILGKAWESSDEEAGKIINVAVGLTSSSPNAAITALLDAQQKEIETLRLDLKSLMALMVRSGGSEEKP